MTAKPEMPDDLERLLCNYTRNDRNSINRFLGAAEACGYQLTRATPRPDVELQADIALALKVCDKLEGHYKAAENHFVFAENGHNAMRFTTRQLRNICAASDHLNSGAAITGETSDGYHTFNELYEHRHILFLALLMSNRDKAWRSKLHSDGTMFDGWFIAGIETDLGQATYHLPERIWGLFDAIKTVDKAPEWDGHTSNDVVTRIREHAIRNTSPAPSEDRQTFDVERRVKEKKDVL